MQRKDLEKCNLPDAPGVYFFKKGRRILYIGKAASLRDRVRSYFSADLVHGRGSAIARMVMEANALTHRKTNSVLEALILEANLIKKHQPPFNVDQKDNKSWNYVVITKEAYPRVLIVRGRELFTGRNKNSIKYLFGPFTQGLALRDAMKMVRRIFPFRDSKCTPCDVQMAEQRRLTTYEVVNNDLRGRYCKPCFNRQIRLCPGVCSGEISQTEYAQTVRSIRDLLSGNFRGLKRRLAREMRVAAKRKDFETAETFRRQVSALEHVRDVALIKNEMMVSTGGGVRIEAYDVAHTAGSETVGVMTVVDNGEPYKAAYRKFTVHTAQNDDIAALREVLSRRLNHSEWPLPRIFVVDGGKAHVRAAHKVLKDAGVMIPIVAVTKDEFHRASTLVGDRRVIEAHERDILLANREAHRFAITWHRSRRRKSMVY